MSEERATTALARSGIDYTIVRHGPLVYDQVGRSATINDQMLDLSARELGLRLQSLRRDHLEFRADLPDGVTVSYDQGDGLYRVDGARGSASVLADWVRAWCAGRGCTTVGLRAETDVRRRAPTAPTTPDRDRRDCRRSCWRNPSTRAESAVCCGAPVPWCDVRLWIG